MQAVPGLLKNQNAIGAYPDACIHDHCRYPQRLGLGRGDIWPAFSSLSYRLELDHY